MTSCPLERAIRTEFHGGGPLAVFAAPRTLEQKERAAVEAAREVVAALAGAIDVGVGIAMGRDYVGNIRGRSYRLRELERAAAANRDRA